MSNPPKIVRHGAFESLAALQVSTNDLCAIDELAISAGLSGRWDIDDTQGTIEIESIQHALDAVLWHTATGFTFRANHFGDYWKTDLDGWLNLAWRKNYIRMTWSGHGTYWDQLNRCALRIQDLIRRLPTANEDSDLFVDSRATENTSPRPERASNVNAPEQRDAMPRSALLNPTTMPGAIIAGVLGILVASAILRFLAF